MTSVSGSKRHITLLAKRALKTDATTAPAVLKSLISELNSEFQRYLQLHDEANDDDDDFESYFDRVQHAKEHVLSLSVDNPKSVAQSSEQDDIKELIANQQRLLEQAFGIEGNGIKNPQAIKLPDISLPSFSGNVTEWPQFHDLFMATIIENTTISNTQKLQYLKSALTGEAHALISPIATSNDNFPIAWKRLVDRYNKPLVIIQNLIMNFMDCKTVSSDLINLKDVVNCARTTIDLLDSQGGYAASRDPWVITLICKKLDRDTNRLWARKSADIKEPSLAVFLQFLESRCSELSLDSLTTGVTEKRPALRVHAAITNKCFCCQGDHGIMKCSVFVGKTLEDREKLIKTLSRCFNCLGRGHTVRNCPSKHSCSICHLKHHTLLHDSKSKGITPSEPVKSIPASSSPDTLQVNTSFDARSSSILPTAVVYIDNVFGKPVPIRILLDSGSQANFLSESFVAQLGLRRERDRVPISRLGEGEPIFSKGIVHATVRSRLNLDDSFSIKAHILPTIIRNYPWHTVSVDNINDLRKRFTFADPEFFRRSNIDMIVSSSFFFNVLKSDRFLSTTNKLFLQDTRLGFVVCSEDSDPSNTVLSNNALIDNSESLSQQIEKFWSVDDVPRPCNTVSPAERECELFFRESTTRLPSGRFSVRLPFLSERPTFRNTYSIALRRLELLERRLSKDNHFRSAYHQFMSEYESLGHMTRLSTSAESLSSIPHFVIPHHGIFQHGQKLRVVFDASAKDESGVSLNDKLHSGPPLQAHITDVLTRFRCGRYVFTCDIAKMYRQIDVHEADRNYQLILWRPSDKSSVALYRLNTVTYGQKCSPFLALRVLNELASNNLQQYPLAANILLQNRYVDDILFANDSREELDCARIELSKLLSTSCFELRKWSSNVSDFLNSLPRDHVVDQLRISDENEVTVPTLGICWIPSLDCFSYQFASRNVEKFTKRALISETARLYDPMGWVSPVTVKLKMLIQEAWVSRIDWDAQLPSLIVSEWVKIRSSMADLRNVQLPRNIGSGAIELHGFSDASKSSYAAVVYSRVTSSDGIVTTRLLMSKTKVAPVKTVSIPRLELCAAHLLVKIIPICAQSLNVPNDRITLWSDSKTVLAWIRSLPRRWTTFVANRVSEIQSCEFRWRYISTKSNPADLPSRGALPSALIDSTLWWNGPDFLQNPEDLPSNDLSFETNIETAAIRCHTITIATQENLEISKEVNALSVHFSNFNRLLHTTAYLFRARDIFLKKSAAFPETLTASELKHAWLFLVRHLQAEHFAAEIDALRRNSHISKSSPIRTLSPEINPDGILIANTRLINDESPAISVRPIILPNCHLVNLLIRKTHLDMYHVGPKAMCSTLRQTYWVPSLMRLVKSFYRSCPRCCRFNARTFTPEMGPLPSFRLRQTKPFAVTGIDFAGPILTRPYKGRGNITLKAYIALLVCASTKAIHLELVMSLSVSSLIMALRRFLARRGRCDVMYSDNGRNFAGCHRALSEFATSIEKVTSDPLLQSFLTDSLIEWKFIPVYSPHFGGLWESGIRSVKSHLSRGFLETTLTIEEFQTALTQIEGVLNSRPLSPVSFTDADIPITPAHLLSGYPISSLPDSFEPVDSCPSAKQRFSAVQAIVSQFWKRWRSDYLPTLMRKPKWSTGSGNPQENDIVIIKRNNDPPRLWALGKIIKLYPGSDKMVRAVDVLCRGRVSRESVRQLIPINVEAPDSTGRTMND